MGIFISAYADDRSLIRFSAIPMLPEKQSYKEFSPFVDYLSQKTKRQIRLDYRPFYDDIINDFIAGEIDLAFLGPLPYVILRERYPDVIPVVAFLNSKGESTYTCSLVKFSGDAETDYSDIALTQPYSTCGYLMTEVLMSRQGKSIQDFTHYYIGDHRGCALSVVKGSTGLAGLKTSIAKQFTHLGVEIIDSTAPLPGFLLVANPKTVDATVVEQIRKSLLRLNPEKVVDRNFMKPWNSIIKNGCEMVNVEAYTAIYEQYRQVHIPGVSK